MDRWKQCAVHCTTWCQLALKPCVKVSSTQQPASSREKWMKLAKLSVFEWSDVQKPCVRSTERGLRLLTYVPAFPPTRWRVILHNSCLFRVFLHCHSVFYLNSCFHVVPRDYLQSNLFGDLVGFTMYYELLGHVNYFSVYLLPAGLVGVYLLWRSFWRHEKFAKIILWLQLSAGLNCAAPDDDF